MNFEIPSIHETGPQNLAEVDKYLSLLDNKVGRKEKKEKLYNQETEQIINFMAGMGKKEEMEPILLKSGVDKSMLERLNYKPNPILGETIKTLEKKYGNPNISLDRPKGEAKDTAGIFDWKENVIYLNVKIFKANLQNEMIAYRLDEMSHCVQHKEKNMAWKHFKDRIRLVANGWDEEKMYVTKGTVEYEAHKIIEPKLYEEFVQIYSDNMTEATKDEDISEIFLRIDHLDLTGFNPETRQKLEKLIERIENSGE